MFTNPAATAEEIRVFTEGDCLHFATALADRMPGGTVAYVVNAYDEYGADMLDHAVYQDATGTLHDIRGAYATSDDRDELLATTNHDEIVDQSIYTHDDAMENITDAEALLDFITPRSFPGTDVDAAADRHVAWAASLPVAAQ